MRIPSGKTDIYLYFVAVDATDYVTRETGLTGFTVYRSRNGAAEVAYTTPTTTEIDATNMPGVYGLLIDEDTTIDSGSDSEEYCVHITKAGMAPVTRTLELYRRDTTSGRTLDVSSGGEAGIDWANVGSQSTSVNLSGTTTNLVNTVTTYTGNTVQTGDSFARIGATGSGLTSLASQASVDTIDGIVDDILLDTAEIGTAGAGLTNINLPDQTMNITGDITGNLSGSVGSVTGMTASDVGAIKAKTDNLPSDPADASVVAGLIAGLNNLSAAQVNAELLDVLTVDTFAEPGQGTPAATTTLANKLAFLYKAWRNKTTQTATTYSLFNDDAATVDHKATTSDDATTFTRGEIASGP